MDVGIYSRSVDLRHRRHSMIELIREIRAPVVHPAIQQTSVMVLIVVGDIPYSNPAGALLHIAIVSVSMPGGMTLTDGGPSPGAAEGPLSKAECSECPLSACPSWS